MLDGKKVLYSGMQATGTLTLGNYLGSLHWHLYLILTSSCPAPEGS